MKFIREMCGHFEKQTEQGKGTKRKSIATRWPPQPEHTAPTGDRTVQRELGTEFGPCSRFSRRCAGRELRAQRRVSHLLSESISSVRPVRSSSGVQIEELSTIYQTISPRQRKAPTNLELVGWNLSVGEDVSAPERPFVCFTK